MTLKIAVAAAALAVATFSLSACGGSDDRSRAAGTPATPAATTPIGLPSDVAAAGDGGDCGGGAADTVKKAVTSSAVTKIQVIGGCTEVSIETSLAPTAKDDGVKICDEAAKVAYTGNVMAVSVDGSDGHELSAGIKGAPCV
jgi:hypothetical protein